MKPRQADLAAERLPHRSSKRRTPATANGPDQADPPPAAVSAGALGAANAIASTAGALWVYDYGRCGNAGTADSAAASATSSASSVSSAPSEPYGIVGIDEAGRGCWAGPVVAAAAFLSPEAYRLPHFYEHCARVNDSKKLNRDSREALFTIIEQWRNDGLLLICAAEGSIREIAEHNILGATAFAMRRAVDGLGLPCELPAGAAIKVGGKPSKASAKAANTKATTSTRGEHNAEKTFAANSAQADFFTELQPEGVPLASGSLSMPMPRLVNPQIAVPPHASGDSLTEGGSRATGSRAASASARSGLSPSLLVPPRVLVDGLPMATRLPWAHEGLVGGDGISLAIAIASIWAKVTRDRLMDRLHAQYPQYSWNSNCGYGTAVHIRALREHGPCPEHRVDFLRKLAL